MVSLIKNQILKHLSRYTKDLSPDKINLSTLKGEGELSSLQLDEVVLTELLELPSWIKLKNACCNKVSFRIQWTKLRTVPIFISLDEVEVVLETCEELRSLSAQQGLSALGATNEYGYISKVIDGITISINTVYLKFNSPAFTASVQIMRILVESKSPEWKKVDLKRTRLKDKAGRQVLIFKELEWHTLRLEAKSTNNSKLPPLRLLTNNKSRCRITIKKRISDCFVMGCQLLLILDDLLWVLTDSQLKAVLHFVESLSGLVQKSTEATRIRKAARKLEVLPEYQAQLSQGERVIASDSTEDAFVVFDVVETSYHFWAQRIDLHLSDDPGDGRSCHPNLHNGGALHLQICDLQVDFYPYHLAAAGRSHWARYNCASSPHVQWLSEAHIAFKNSLLNLIKAADNNSRGSKETLYKADSLNSEKKPVGPRETHNVNKYVSDQIAKVMTSCFIIRICDFVVNRVSTNNKTCPKEFIRGDRQSFPADVSLHAEFTYYYYPGDIPFPLPPPKFYVQLNPVIVNFDLLTVLWLNSFTLNLQQSLSKKPQDSPTANYLDVKIEAIMPKLVFEVQNESNYGQRDRPRSLQIQVSRAMISNVRSPDSCSRADLVKCIHSLQLGSLFYATDFPSKSEDFVAVPEKFINHVQYKDNVREAITQLIVSSEEELVSKLSRTMLWTESRDIWCINLEPLWGDFFGARGIAHNRPVPFLDAFPLKIWVHANLDQPGLSQSPDIANIHALAHSSTLISLQLNHYQFLFLLKLADEFTELSTIIAMDTDRIKKGGNSSLVVSCVIPQVEVTLVMPCQTPGKESSGADAESVIPDTSSLADEIITNASFRCNSLLTANVQDIGFDSVNNSAPTTALSLSYEMDVVKIEPVKQSNFNPLANLTSMKKGLASIIDSARKPIIDDLSDTLSTRSDGSTDSENCIGKICNPGDALFRIDGNDPYCPAVEVASEVIEDEDNLSGPTLSITTTSENPSNASFYRRKDMISVATLKLGQVEVVQQSKGFESSFKVHVSNIAIEECPAIPWDEFQNKFSCRTRGWNEVCEKPADRPRIRLRFNHLVNVGDPKTWSGPRNESWFDDFLAVSMANINLTVNTATLAGVAEFLIDDIASPPLPTEVIVENIELSLTEDKINAVVHNNVPINILVSYLHLRRNKDGVLLIEPSETKKENHGAKEHDNLKLENEQLRRRLAAMERLNEENNHLRKCEEEINVLRSYLNEAQDKVNQLLNEKQSLLDFIKELQCKDVKHNNSGKR